MIIGIEYLDGYGDALMDVMNWFCSESRAVFLKDTRINRKAITAVLRGFVEYKIQFMRDKTEFDLELAPVNNVKGKITGYKIKYKITQENRRDLAMRIGELAIRALEQEATIKGEDK